MKTTIRKMGNSRGVLIPKLVLAEVGLEDEADMVVENNTIVLRKPHGGARAGWAEASQKLATAGDNAQVWLEFGNQDDAKLKW